MPKDKSQGAKIKPENTRRPEKKPPKKITETYLHNAGLYYLQRFAASKAHFKTVMLRKVKKSCLYHKDQDEDKCRDMVDALADKFEGAGLLNDRLYTQGMITSLRRRGLSRKAILAKMAFKGIDAGQTQMALQDYDDREGDGKDAELRAALRLARRKKIGPYDMDGKKSENKALSALARAGFSYETSRLVLDMKPERLPDYA